MAKGGGNDRLSSAAATSQLRLLADGTCAPCRAGRPRWPRTRANHRPFHVQRQPASPPVSRRRRASRHKMSSLILCRSVFLKMRERQRACHRNWRHVTRRGGNRLHTRRPTCWLSRARVRLGRPASREGEYLTLSYTYPRSCCAFRQVSVGRSSRLGGATRCGLTDLATN